MMNYEFGWMGGGLAEPPQHRDGIKLLRRQTVFDSSLRFNNMLDC
jgi:hypothetical protein